MATTQRLMKSQIIIPKVKCEYCFNSYSKLHPCLFCDDCLIQCTKIIDRSTNGLVRLNIHSTMQKEKKLKLARAAGRAETESEKQARESKTSIKTEQEQKAWKILEKAALQLEKRATRCGFCLPTEKRKKLVRYCGHCQKHMCGSCDVKHSKHTLCKHHATVDLLAESNGALM